MPDPNATGDHHQASSQPEIGENSFGDLLPNSVRHLAFLLNEHPLLPSADNKHYEILVRAFLIEIAPIDGIELLWLRDILGCVWEARQLRRWRDEMLLRAYETKLIEKFGVKTGPIGEYAGIPTADLDAQKAIKGYIAGDKNCEEKLIELARKRGVLNIEQEMSRAFRSQLSSVEKIDRMLIVNDLRRDSLFREIRRKRAVFEKNVRAIAAKIE